MGADEDIIRRITNEVFVGGNLDVSALGFSKSCGFENSPVSSS